MPLCCLHAACNCLACGLAVAGVSHVLVSSTEQSEQFGSRAGAKHRSRAGEGRGLGEARARS